MPDITEETTDEATVLNDTKQGNSSNEMLAKEALGEAQESDRELNSVSDELVSNVLEKVKMDLGTRAAETKQTDKRRGECST